MEREKRLPRWKCEKCGAEWECLALPRYCEKCENYYDIMKGVQSRIVCIEIGDYGRPPAMGIY